MDHTFSFHCIKKTKTPWRLSTISARPAGKYNQFYSLIGGSHNRDLLTIYRLAPKSISYAGTKDRRAITVQNVTAYHALAEKLARAQESLNRQGIYVANFKYVKTALKLGDLKGNRFGIVLR